MLNASVDGLSHNITRKLKVCILGVEVEKKINRIEDRLGYNQLQSVHTYFYASRATHSHGPRLFNILMCDMLMIEEIASLVLSACISQLQPITWP